MAVSMQIFFLKAMYYSNEHLLRIIGELNTETHYGNEDLGRRLSRATIERNLNHSEIDLIYLFTKRKKNCLFSGIRVPTP